MINTKTQTKVWVVRVFGYRGILSELPKLILGNKKCYPNLGSGTSSSGNSGPGSGSLGMGNGY
jgi:hypothetical protein